MKREASRSPLWAPLPKTLYAGMFGPGLSLKHVAPLSTNTTLVRPVTRGNAACGQNLMLNQASLPMSGIFTWALPIINSMALPGGSTVNPHAL